MIEIIIVGIFQFIAITLSMIAGTQYILWRLKVSGYDFMYDDKIKKWRIKE